MLIVRVAPCLTVRVLIVPVAGQVGKADTVDQCERADQYFRQGREASQVDEEE